MDVGQFLFSVKGRVNRKLYWLGYFLPFLALQIILQVASLATHKVPLLAIPILIFNLIFFYIGVVITVKRIHDRGRTGWFFLVLFVPIVNLWPLVEIYFLKGTEGDNEFGADLVQA